jgi:predicted nucleic acid-binding protein
VTLAAVTDTGPLIHLAEIDSLDLLSILEELYVPETVYDELEAGGVPDGLSDLQYTRVSTEGEGVGDERLDPGERTALAVANERDITLLTDDLAARETAAELGIDVHGSIGIIALGHARGHIDRPTAATRMRELQRETSLFVSDAVVERGIELLDDS